MGLLNLKKWGLSYFFNQKMISVLHEELQHKVENLRHMNLEVTQLKIKKKSEFLAYE